MKVSGPQLLEVRREASSRVALLEDTHELLCRYTRTHD